MSNPPHDYDAVLGEGNNTNQPSIEVKVRIEGATINELDEVIKLLRQQFYVMEESRDYPNRREPGIRRYLTIRVK